MISKRQNILTITVVIFLRKTIFLYGFNFFKNYLYNFKIFIFIYFEFFLRKKYIFILSKMLPHFDLR